LAEHHDFVFDVQYRKALIEKGIYHFPLATKQGSISAVYTAFDEDETPLRTREVLRSLA